MHVSSCGVAHASAAAAGCVDASSLLGPSTGAQRNFWGTPQPGGQALSPAGVWWRVSSNATATQRLSDAMYTDVTAAVLTPVWNNTVDSVVFTVDYALLGAGTLVTEAYTVTSDGAVAVTATVAQYAPAALAAWLASVGGAAAPADAHRLAARLADPAASSALVTLPPGARPPPPPPADSPAAAAATTITAYGVSFLALLDDGANATKVTVDEAGARSVTVALGADSQTFALAPAPAGRTYAWAYDPASKSPQLTRNGHAMLVDVAVTGGAPAAKVAVAYSLRMAGGGA